MSTLVQTAVSEQAKARPDAMAVAWNNARMSYGELETASNRLARLLADAGCRRGDRVGLMMPKMPTAIAAILGVIKAGAAYVPLDPTDPAVRLASTLESADCRMILAAGSVAIRLGEALERAALEHPPRIGWLGEEAPAELPLHFTRGDLDAFPDASPEVAIGGDDLAQMLFTSGSTGTPKGVMITHANILHVIHWAIDYFGISNSDRVAQHVPLRFDLSTLDIFTALSTGASLWLVPQELTLLPTRLAEFMREAKLTQCLVVPSLLNLMAKFDVVRHNDFPDLRRMLFCGEVLPTPSLIYWMERLPHVQFTNLYGPTETTVCSSYYTVPRCPENELEPIPIGVPCEGEELLILDEHLQAVAEGEIGDLYIAGPGLSLGYWRDPGKTERAFLEYTNAGSAARRIYRTGDLAMRDADGLHHFCGRSDMQIKCRGYRVELGEVETALHTLPELRESAVVAIETGGFEGAQICCAYAVDPETECSTTQLRRRLAELVPNYMLPGRWKRYETLPKNVNGKIDRARLRSEFHEDDNGRQPDRTGGAEWRRGGMPEHAYQKDKAGVALD